MKKIFRVAGYDEENKQIEPSPTKGKEKDKGNEKDKNDPLMTPFGELVFMRNGTNKDFVSKQRLTSHEPRDEVLEENLLDVKNLLKNSTVAGAANGR